MKHSESVRPVLLSALILSVPAFYLILNGPHSHYPIVGRVLYAIAALLIAADFFVRRKSGQNDPAVDFPGTDIFIALGSLASAWPTAYPWSLIEWLLRLAFSGVVFIRIATLVAHYIVPHRLVQTCLLAAVTMLVAGGGFLWLEPEVHSFAEGVWLAFSTGATVGYGDIVPSTPASRIFATFIVLIGYALFSVVTANIAALLVGEDEKRIRREIHADMRKLREEIAALRVELRVAESARDPEKN